MQCVRVEATAKATAPGRMACSQPLFSYVVAAFCRDPSNTVYSTLSNSICLEQCKAWPITCRPAWALSATALPSPLPRRARRDMAPHRARLGGQSGN
jgi:hypothetical protein